MIIGEVSFLRQARNCVATEAPFPIKPHLRKCVSKIRQLGILVWVFALRENGSGGIYIFVLKTALLTLHIEHAVSSFEAVVQVRVREALPRRFVLNPFVYNL